MHVAKVVVVSPNPYTPHHHHNHCLPPLQALYRLDTNNLVIDDVEAEKVQKNLEEKGGREKMGLLFLWLHFIYHLCFSHSIKD